VTGKKDVAVMVLLRAKMPATDGKLTVSPNADKTQKVFIAHLPKCADRIGILSPQS
jgi:hypothetical protein